MSCWKDSRYVLLAAAILTLAVGLCCADDGVSEPAAAEGPAEALLSGPYVIDVTSGAATICWQTRDERAAEVRVDAVGGETVCTITRPKLSRFHSERITGLSPGVEYRAAVRTEGATTAEVTFRANPAEAQTFTFFAYGDTRTNSRDHAEVAAAIAAEAARRRQFTFLLHTGDFASSGANMTETAEEFFAPAATLLRRMILVPVRGNHEDAATYRKYFPPEPSALQDVGADDRCIDYGSVRLVVLDKYAPSNMLPGRLKWLAARLAEVPDKWRIVSFHEPMYSSGKHRSATRFRAAVEPVLIAGKVHAVMAGHDHDYERTRPISGIVHLTTGGGGAPLREESSRGLGEWSEKFETRHHFMAVGVTPERQEVRVYGRVGETERFELYDSVDIPKVCAWPEPEPSAPAESDQE
jgi:hypothetical protein